MSESRRNGKDLLSHLEATGKTEYGSVITGEEVREVLGIELPRVASKRTFEQLALRELGAVDYVRNVLLGRGRYLGQDAGAYRIYLPSETAEVLARYTASADRKLRRALKLWRSAPKTDQGDLSNEGARILLKRESIKNRKY